MCIRCPSPALSVVAPSERASEAEEGVRWPTWRLPFLRLCCWLKCAFVLGCVCWDWHTDSREGGRAALGAVFHQEPLSRCLAFLLHTWLPAPLRRGCFASLGNAGGASFLTLRPPTTAASLTRPKKAWRGLGEVRLRAGGCARAVYPLFAATCCLMLAPSPGGCPGLIALQSLAGKGNSHGHPGHWGVERERLPTPPPKAQVWRT